MSSPTAAGYESGGSTDSRRRISSSSSSSCRRPHQRHNSNLSSSGGGGGSSSTSGKARSLPPPRPPSLLSPLDVIPSSPSASSTSSATGGGGGAVVTTTSPPLLPASPTAPFPTSLDHHLDGENDDGGIMMTTGSTTSSSKGRASSSFLSSSSSSSCESGSSHQQVLPRELLVQVLAYLRAWDLAALSQTCALFADLHLMTDVVAPMLASYNNITPTTTASPSTPTALSSSPGNPSTMLMMMTTTAGGGSPYSPSASGGGASGVCTTSLGSLLEGLRYQEVAYVHRALSTPEPATGGYWVSKAWANNHRRFAESMAARRKAAASSSSSHHRRRSSARERRESDIVAPWPEVNADITCEHGNLRPLGLMVNGGGAKGGAGGQAGGGGGKRRVVDKKGWRALRRFYGGGQAFKTSSAVECGVCQAGDRAHKDKLDEEKRSRETELHAHPALARLFDRRTGAPVSMAGGGVLEGGGLPPLDPGIYHLVPRAWLSAWRTYIRDPKAPRPRPPECCVLLCEAHGLPLIPPHVSDFLQGDRKSLLSNLTSRAGVVCEVLDTEEWDELNKIYPTDFCLKFSVDPWDEGGGVITWSTAPCDRCDPCYDQAPVTVRNRQRKWSF